MPPTNILIQAMVRKALDWFGLQHMVTSHEYKQNQDAEGTVTMRGRTAHFVWDQCIADWDVSSLQFLAVHEVIHVVERHFEAVRKATVPDDLQDVWDEAEDGRVDTLAEAIAPRIFSVEVRNEGVGGDGDHFGERKISEDRTAYVEGPDEEAGRAVSVARPVPWYDPTATPGIRGND
jgi:predicted metal-dependent peptidase